MGIGIVLIGWTVFCGCLAIPFAVGFGIWSWLWGRRAGRPSPARALAASLLPFIAMVVAMVWFMGYWTYSEAVRGVDPGLGDSWSVPIRYDYFFCMIDTTDDGYLMEGGCSGSPPVGGIEALAQSGDFVVGVSHYSGPFLFNLASGETTHYPTIDEALNQLSPPPVLQTPGEFYGQRRHGWQDDVALLILLTAEALLAWMWFRWFVRPPQEKPVEASNLVEASIGKQDANQPTEKT